MKKSTCIIVVLAILAVAALIVVIGVNPRQDYGTNEQPPLGKLVTGSDIETFSGTIESVDTGCFYDATCSVTVDGKKVILITGGRGVPPETRVGRLIGVESVGDIEQRIGDHANVYAAKTPEGDWTIYGKEEYYVEVVTVRDN